MNIDNIRFTNQKQASAEIHLRQLQTALLVGARDIPKALISTHCQAIVFDLVLSCHAFMQEIAADYQQSVAIGGSYADLELLLNESDVVCQQCTWLAELESQHDSWLYWLQGEYQKCWTNGVLSSPVHYVNDTNLIAFEDVTSMKIEDRLKNCFEELELVIAQYRQLMQEW
ncbi:MAG: hypothetical protein ACI9ES_002281 [Oceanospirillaceae bacterium]